MGVAQADGPLRDGNLDCGRARPTGATPGRIPPSLAPGVGPGVRRTLQDLAHPKVVWCHPDHVLRSRTTHGPHRQQQAVAPQVPRHRVGALQLAEPSKDQVQAGLHLLIRVKDDFTAAPVGKAGWQWQAEFATGGFLALTLMQP
jgi:hypothetical protein